MLKLGGRTAVIIGGSGVVGYSIVEKFLEEGMNVATIHSRQENADMTQKWLKNFERRYLSFSYKTGDFLSTIYEKFGSIDVVVCGQGWPPDRKNIEGITNEYWNSLLNSHLTRSFFIVKDALPYLKKSIAPRIIFFSSNEARTGCVNDGIPYTVAKGGILSLTFCLARELAKYGITVNAVAMGAIYNKPIPVGDGNPDLKMLDYEDMKDQIPLGRLGKPEDICTAVCYLVSEEAGFVTGEVINVSGGLSMG